MMTKEHDYTLKRLAGFTIVELLVVVVVIAILAAISIVSYNGIVMRASSLALQSDLANAARQLSMEYAQEGIYPGEDDTTTNGGTLERSDGTTFEYTRSNNGTQFCLLAKSSRSGIPTAIITHDNLTPREGTCPVNATSAGENWTVIAAPATGSWSSVTYGNGRFVAVGVNKNEVLISSNGIDWSTAPSPSSPWRQVVFGGGRFVAIASALAIMTSNDGLTWSAQSGLGLSALVYGDGEFVATTANSSNNRSATSLDGSDWEVVPIGFHGERALAYGDGRYVALPKVNGSTTIALSTDGRTWSEVASPTLFSSIAFGNGRFVASGYSLAPQRVYTSLDGTSWEAASITDPISTVTFGGGRFIAAGSGQVFTSTDGINWESHSTPQTGNWSSVAYGAGCFVAVRSVAGSQIMYSCED